MTAVDELSEQVRARRRLPPPAMRRALRAAAGASLEDVARAVGVTRQAVGLWEKGDRAPKGENLIAYVRALEVFREADGP